VKKVVDENVAKVWTLTSSDINDDDLELVDDEDLLDEDDLKKPDPNSLKGQPTSFYLIHSLWKFVNISILRNGSIDKY